MREKRGLSVRAERHVGIENDIVEMVQGDVDKWIGVSLWEKEGIGLCFFFRGETVDVLGDEALNAITNRGLQHMSIEEICPKDFVDIDGDHFTWIGSLTQQILIVSVVKLLALRVD